MQELPDEDAVLLPDNFADILGDELQGDEPVAETAEEEYGESDNGDSLDGDWDFSESVAAALEVSAFEEEPASEFDMPQNDEVDGAEEPADETSDEAATAKTGGRSASEETETEERSSENV